jgi:hypothetical protein
MEKIIQVKTTLKVSLNKNIKRKCYSSKNKEEKNHIDQKLLLLQETKNNYLF